jgi:hypothetical protein
MLMVKINHISFLFVTKINNRQEQEQEQEQKQEQEQEHEDSF